MRERLIVLILALGLASASVAEAQAKKPNILVIFGDDIGWYNVSAYNHGVMGYRTPNIDRIAKEGAMFTDWYAQQSCTAGRAAFVTGQAPIRTGLTKDGKPFFVWFNSTRMHIFTHLKAASKGKTGLGTYPDGTVEHDGMVGQLLKKLDDLGIASNTIVVYGTDNGAEVMSWPDGGTTPYRGEKATNW